MQGIGMSRQQTGIFMQRQAILRQEFRITERRIVAAEEEIRIVEKDPDPDTETEGLDTAAVQSTESEDEQEKPVLEVEYKLLKRIYESELQALHTGPGGLIITAFGLVLTVYR